MVAALVMSALPSPPSNAIDLAPLSIRAYGVAIGIGALLAVRIAQRRWAARGEVLSAGASGAPVRTGL